MTTYTLTMTPADAPHTVHTGLTREEALWALADLVYGTDIAGLGAPQDGEPEERLAA